MDTSAKTTPGSPAGTGLIKDTAYTFMHVANPALGGDEVAKAIAKRYGATTLQKSVRMSDATADGLTPPSIPLAEDDEEGRRRNEEAERLEMRAQFYEKQAALRQFEGAIGDAQTLRQKAMTARNDALQIRTSRTRNPGYVGL